MNVSSEKVAEQRSECCATVFTELISREVKTSRLRPLEPSRPCLAKLLRAALEHEKTNGPLVTLYLREADADTQEGPARDVCRGVSVENCRELGLYFQQVQHLIILAALSAWTFGCLLCWTVLLITPFYF